MQINFQHQKGFTLIELIIATAIVSVIGAISTSAYTGYIDTTKNSQAAEQIRTLSLLIDDYALEYDRYPESLEDIGNQNIKDPWGNPYVYLNLISSSNGQSSGGESSTSSSSSDEHDMHDDDHSTDVNISEARKDGNLVPINTKYDLCSYGKDSKSKAPLRAKDSHDDIIYANDGGYIGLASEF